jgi:ParB/RepB/Spo0J family partition protein
MRQVLDVLITAVEPNPLNPDTRVPDKELIASIKEYGILTPLLIRQNGSPDSFIIVAGERRYRAAKELGLPTVPCIKIEGEKLDAIVLVDNIHRRNMNPVEEAEIIKQLIVTEGSVKNVAKVLGKTTRYVIQRLQLENLSEKVRKDVFNNAPGLTERVLFMLAKLPHSLQNKVRARCTNEFIVNGKNALAWDDETQVDGAIATELREDLFKNDPAFVATLAPEFGTKDLNAQIRAAFDDTKEAVAPTPEQVAAVTEVFKKARANSYALLSTRSWTSRDDVLTNDLYRFAKKDDEKVEFGMIIDGDQIGVVKQFVRLDKKANSVAKVEKQAEKKMDPKEVEKRRKERREKILNNKAEARARQLMLESIVASKPGAYADKQHSAFRAFVVDQLNHMDMRYAVRTLVPEPTEKQLNNIQGTYLELTKSFDFYKLIGLFFAAKMLNQAYQTADTEVAAGFGFNLKAMRTEARKAIEKELAEAKARKEQEKAEKAKRTGKVPKK